MICEHCGARLADAGQSGYYCETPRCRGAWYGGHCCYAGMQAAPGPCPYHPPPVEKNRIHDRPDF